MDRMWVARLRWRVRGAWLWPAFAGLTLLDGVLIVVLPPWGQGPESVVGGVLAAGFANLIVVAALAPLLGRGLRRRRGDLPRSVADDYAGTGLLLVLAALMLGLGLLHRPARLRADGDQAAAARSVADFARSRPALGGQPAGGSDVIRLSERSFRACVPTARPGRSLCVFVDADQRPPGITLDADRSPNGAYRAPGGLG